MNVGNNMHQVSPSKKHQFNYLYEVLIVRTARELYEFIDAEDDADAIQKIQPLLYALLISSNKYHNETSGLHPDLGLDLREWATLKQSYLRSLTKSNLTDQQVENDRAFIDEYGQSAQKIIAYLEDVLGLNNQVNHGAKHEANYPKSHWDPIGSAPPYVGVIAGTEHIASFRTGGPNGGHTLIADGDYSDDNDGFSGDSQAPGYNHYGSKSS